MIPIFSAHGTDGTDQPKVVQEVLANLKILYNHFVREVTNGRKVYLSLRFSRETRFSRPEGQVLWATISCRRENSYLVPSPGTPFPTTFCANISKFSNWSQDRLANVSLKFCCTNLTIHGMQSGTYLRTNQLLLQGFSRVWCVWNRNRRFEKVVSWIAHLNIMLNHQPAFLPLRVQNHDDDYGGGGKSSLLPQQSPDDGDDGCNGLSMHTIWQFLLDAKMMF